MEPYSCGPAWIVILLQCLAVSLITAQTGRNVSCNNCDCSIFQSISTCPIPRHTNRRDCPCCQTCLRQAGELCDEIAFPCDQEFGLYCNTKTDTCDGLYGLRASKVNQNSMLLIWHRPPEVQGHLYLFYTQTYTSDLRLWIMQETFAGADSSYIQGLNAATFYYVALVPEFQGVFYFENRSEILVKKTEGCLHKNQSYAVGETFADGCAYNCTCTPEGLLACIERRCPLMYKKGDIQDPLCKEHDDPASPDPCCVIYTCQNGHPSSPHPPPDSQCLYKGKHYALATEFYDDDCSMTCYCDEIGVVDCRPLKCPEPSVPLGHNNGSCLEWDVKQHAVRNPPHCCPNYTCINDGRCDINGTKYRHSETLPSSCDQHCLCDSGKVVCESVCPEVSPNPPFDSACIRFTLVKDSSGCCMEWQCITPHSSESADECIVGNMRYPVGAHWSETEHCRPKNCTCQRNLQGMADAACSGGCPDLDTALHCEKPAVVHSDDPCTCPVAHCPDMKNELRNAETDPVYSLRAGLVNSSAAELILNVSSVLLSHTGAALETHIARVDHGGQPRNVSDMWQISSTKLDQLQPTVIEYITGFQSNSTYKIKARLILTDSASNTDVILPFTSTIFLNIPARGLTCVVENVAYDEGASIPQGCGQECVCHNGSAVCHAVQCTSQESVILASEFCPVPVLVKGPRDCCPRWECHPSATGCKVGDIIYSHGDHWKNGCAEECHCRRGIITCRDLCLEHKRSQPHPSCQFVNISGSCCPVWNCHEGAAVPVLDYAHGLDNSMMNLTADSVTNSQARLTWQKPAELRNIFGFTVIVEEAVMDRESYREAKLVHPEIQEYIIHDLAPNTRYTATIKAMEDSDRVVASQSIQFQTLDASDVMLMLWLAYIGPDKAEAIWECQHCDEFKHLKLSLISGSNSEVAVGDVTPGLPKITLTSLHPKENYQLLLEGVTVAGLSVKSNVIAFSTRSVADFNEIPREFQNVTDASSPIMFALDTQQQKLSTALIIVSVLCTLFFVAFFIAAGLCCYYRRALILQKANAYQTYSTDTMYR
ncbi:uncharacterized protein LOC129581839 isoform X2 [Paramacrobiotus metropolitanus]|uniref:uncharacterized protein LOC129581839 isoform X2 n=1 Tax=Paramacrobiotus metropolitanus TaxID=2943436 RepID=UPI00244650B8|nr:uncharacterized protein LOC129581839 isoform X2 [Paramacrobiotus metropolitanus]